MNILISGRTQQQEDVIPLSNAVFCLDCEVVSNSRGEECTACHGRSLLSLGRILGGSLRDRKPQEESAGGPFDITLTVTIQQMHAKDVNVTLEGLTRAIGPQLAEGRASFHINVQPRAAASIGTSTTKAA